MVTVPHWTVGLDRMLDYRGVRLERVLLYIRTSCPSWLDSSCWLLWTTVASRLAVRLWRCIPSGFVQVACSNIVSTWLDNAFQSYVIVIHNFCVYIRIRIYIPDWLVIVWSSSPSTLVLLGHDLNLDSLSRHARCVATLLASVDWACWLSVEV